MSGAAIMSPAPSQQSLIEQAAAGDRVALEQLLLHYHDRLARHVARHFPDELKGVLDTEDILHQTYVRVFRAIGTFEARSEHAFYAWLKTIATNQLRDAGRRRRRERPAGGRRCGPAGGDPQSWVVDMADRAAADTKTPSRNVARREAVAAMQVALASLSEGHRQAIRLRYLEGRSLEETAAILGCTPDAVRGLCHRAKKKLREALGRASLYLSR